eukprot:365584-Chlamydomonas_euryale.AAC.13
MAGAADRLEITVDVSDMFGKVCGKCAPQGLSIIVAVCERLSNGLVGHAFRRGIETKARKAACAACAHA